MSTFHSVLVWFDSAVLDCSRASFSGLSVTFSHFFLLSQLPPSAFLKVRVDCRGKKLLKSTTTTKEEEKKASTDVQENSPHQKDVRSGCVRETPTQKRSQLGMYKGNFPHKNEGSLGYVRETIRIKISQHGMCKRNSPHKNKGSTGCVKVTPHIKMKQARDV